MAIHQAVTAPGAPEMPEIPEAPTASKAPELEMPDLGDPVKKKMKQATILKGAQGGAAGTILSGGGLGLGG